MMRFPSLLHRSRAFATKAAPAAATKVPVAASSQYATVKFVKEDVNEVMKEVPSYSFYELKESEPNPYAEATLDRSILLDQQAPKLIRPGAEFSKLENGLKVVSIDKQGLTARLGLYVNAGSRYEDSSNFGVSHMVSMMGYTSTAHLSHLRTVKTLEQLGSNHTSSCVARREDITYKVDVMREFVPLVLPMMIGNVLFPRLLPWEVKSAHKKVKESQEAMAKDPDAELSELLHKAAFCNNSLGYSTKAADRAMSYFTPETIRGFMLDHFAPERMVLVGVNVEHADLAKWAMRSFADYNAIPMKERPATKAKYTGGDLRADATTPFCHVALALESCAFGARELAPITLLQTILGGGNAVRQDVGTGVTSRLSSQIVANSPHVESLSAFNTSYSDSGLFGVYGVCQPQNADLLVADITKVLHGMKDIGKDELARAKAMLKGNLYRQADDDIQLLDEIGSQVLLSGTYRSAGEFASAVDKVTEADIKAAATKLLSGRPTLAAIGDTHAVPHYSAVEKALKA